MKKIPSLLLVGLLLYGSSTGQTLQTVTDTGSVTTNPITISPAVTATSASTVSPALALKPDYFRLGAVTVIPFFTVATGNATGSTYTVSPANVKGSGSGLVVKVAVASNYTSTVTVVDGGSGYAVGDQLSIPRSAVGGAATGTYSIYVGNVTTNNSYDINHAPLSITGYSQGSGYEGAFTPMMSFNAQYRDNTQSVEAPLSLGYYYKTASTPYWAFAANGAYILGFATTGPIIGNVSATAATVTSAYASTVNITGGVSNSGVGVGPFYDNTTRYLGGNSVTGSSFISNQTIQAGAVASLAITSAGSGYTAGIYTGIATTGGSGSGLRLFVTVGATGTVTAVAIDTTSAAYYGSDYLQGESVGITLSGGSGFAAAVTVRQGQRFAALTNTGTFKSKTADNYYTVKSMPVINQETGATGNVYGFLYDPVLTGLQGQHIAFQNVTGNVYMCSTSGNVGIGTTKPTEKLSVKGTVLAQRVYVSVNAADWPDFVFSPSYKPLSLSQTAAYIQQYKHLPELPSSAEVQKNGVVLNNSQATLLKKIEELTLYIIEQNKQLDIQEQRLQQLEQEQNN